MSSQDKGLHFDRLTPWHLGLQNTLCFYLQNQIIDRKYRNVDCYMQKYKFNETITNKKVNKILLCY